MVVGDGLEVEVDVEPRIRGNARCSHMNDLLPQKYSGDGGEYTVDVYVLVLVHSSRNFAIIAGYTTKDDLTWRSDDEV